MVLDSPEYVMREKIMRNVCGNENPERLREKVVKVLAKETHLERGELNERLDGSSLSEI
jgi:predicted secreted protein